MSTRDLPDFHFARIYRGDTYDKSLARHKHYLYMKLRLKPGFRVLEIGCGLGFAAFELANFSNVHVIGIDIDTHKVAEANKRAHELGMSQLLTFITGDYSRLGDYFPMESFDAIYSIEALRSASSFEAVYSQFRNLLKLGGRVALYEWCWTDAMNFVSHDHRRLARVVETATHIGNRDPEKRSITCAMSALQNSGLQVLECVDVAADQSTGAEWYSALEKALSNSRTPWNMHGKPSNLFGGLTREGAASLLYAGKFKLFTPMLMVAAQKLEAEAVE